MTVGSNSVRRALVVLVMAMVPLLMAIAVNFPAQAGAPAAEVDVEPVPVAPPPQTKVPAVDLDVADEVLPRAADGPGYAVILDTGVETVGYESGGAEVVGHESSISALAVVAIPETDPAQSSAPSGVAETESGD